VSGDASDILAEVALVQIQVRRANKYLQSDYTWDTPVNSFNCSGTDSWDIDLPTTCWVNNSISTITAIATDTRGNAGSASSPVSFMFDNAVPVTVLKLPTGTHNYNATTYPLNMLWGTASDNQQYSKVYVRIRNGGSEEYWDDTANAGEGGFVGSASVGFSKSYYSYSTEVVSYLS